VGYDVHITRAKEWYDSEKSPITLEEWHAYLTSDPEMRLDGYAEATTPEGATIRIESEGLAVWTRHSGNGLDGNMAWFDYRNGQIVVNNPDDEILDKMKAIAAALHARVIGDEGEEY